MFLYATGFSGLLVLVGVVVFSSSIISISSFQEEGPKIWLLKGGLGP